MDVGAGLSAWEREAESTSMSALAQEYTHSEDDLGIVHSSDP